MSNITAIKAAIDTAVTNKTVADSITPAILGASMKTIADELRPYKVYTAIINQTGTNAPTVAVLGTNEIGAIVWTRDNIGVYSGTLAGAFPESKVIVFSNLGGSVGFTRWVNGAPNAIGIRSFDELGSPADDRFSQGAIKIEVYP